MAAPSSRLEILARGGRSDGLSESDPGRYGIAILLVVMQQQPNPICVFFRPDTGDSPLQLVFGHPFSAEHVKTVTSVCMRGMPAKGDICNLNSQTIMLQILIQGVSLDSVHPSCLNSALSI